MKTGYNDNTKPIADTSFNVHETIIGMLGPGRGRRALDVGAGFGMLSEKLSAAGYDVRACELDPVRARHMRKLGIKCDVLDLNRKLPYGDASFDLVTCSDVIEHLKNPCMAIEEISRVARKGATVVITIPNILNWYSRLKFLVSGEYNNYFTRKEFIGDGYHISPLHFYQIEWMMAQSGLKITETTSNQYTGLLNRSNPRIFFSSLAVLPLRPFMKPRGRALLEGDILVIKALKK